MRSCEYVRVSWKNLAASSPWRHENICLICRPQSELSVVAKSELDHENKSLSVGGRVFRNLARESRETDLQTCMARKDRDYAVVYSTRSMRVSLTYHRFYQATTYSEKSITISFMRASDSLSLSSANIHRQRIFSHAYIHSLFQRLSVSLCENFFRCCFSTLSVSI